MGDILAPLLVRPIRFLLQNWMWWGMVLAFIFIKRTISPDADGYLSTDTALHWIPAMLAHIPGINQLLSLESLT
ncbi:MAG: hypothetical protein Q3962_07360 [Corynebacterium sp.]|nr:hypothetical protein [Corynebacterium sp.]